VPIHLLVKTVDRWTWVGRGLVAVGMLAAAAYLVWRFGWSWQGSR
jgi:hypothetical protein